MLLPTVLLLSLAAAPPPEDISAATRAWEEGRLGRLQSDDGWLTLVGLGWLKEGSNTAGSDGKAVVVFPEGAPASVGTFTRSGTSVSFQPAPGVTVTRGGKPFPGGAVQTDQEGRAEPDVFQLGRLRFQVIVRGDRIGVRIKDPEARARKEFKGIPTYPASARWRLTARWEPSNPPTEIAVPNVLGQVERSPSPGTAVFTVDGKEYRLTPVLEEGSPELFFVFARRDQPDRDLRGGAVPLRRRRPRTGRSSSTSTGPTTRPARSAPSRPVRCHPGRTGSRCRVDAGEKRPAH